MCGTPGLASVDWCCGTGEGGSTESCCSSNFSLYNLKSFGNVFQHYADAAQTTASVITVTATPTSSVVSGSSTESTGASDNSSHNASTIGVAVGVPLGVLAIASFVFLVFWKRRSSRRQGYTSTSPVPMQPRIRSLKAGYDEDHNRPVPTELPSSDPYHELSNTQEPMELAASLPK